MHGAHPQRKSGAGESFWQYREYAPSDRPQDIDWRQSAKGDDVLVRQREWHTTQKTFLWCAGGQSMDFCSDKHLMSKQDCAMLISLSLALLLRRGEETIGVFGNMNTGRSDARMEKIGDYLLSRHDQGGSLPDPSQFEIPRQSSLIAVGDFLSSKTDIRPVMAQLSGATNNATIIQVLDPAEIELPYRGRVRFEGANLSSVVDNVPSVRDAYQARMSKHIAFIQSLCHDYGWHYILHRTDRDIADSLKEMVALHDFSGGGL